MLRRFEMKNWQTLALGLLIWPLGANCTTTKSVATKAEAKPKEHVLQVSDGRDIVIKAADGSEILRINSKGELTYREKKSATANEITLAFYESVMGNDIAHANCLVRVNQFRKALLDASVVHRPKPELKPKKEKK